VFNCRRSRFGDVMTNPYLRTPFGEVELRPARSEPGEMRVYLLLPDLDELVGVPGFGLANPIRVATRPRGIALQ
jgi:hypothetical protein